MKQRFFVDHHIQTSVLDVLKQAPAAFSELKPRGVENSLFMYHLRKLLARGIVHKTIEQYELTPQGALWCNNVDDRYRMTRSPRALVQLLVIDDGSVLVRERRGAMGEHLNQYMLPALLHAYGAPRDEIAAEVAARHGLMVDEFLLQSEFIIEDKDLHVVSDIYRAHVRQLSGYRDDGHMPAQFVAVEIIKALTHEQAGMLPGLLRRLDAGDVGAYELFD